MAKEDRSSEAADYREWRARLALFDPQNLLPELMRGVDAALRDLYPSFCAALDLLARADPALAKLYEADCPPPFRPEQFRERLTAPLAEPFYRNAVTFARMVTEVDASPHAATALLSRAHGETMKAVLERLDGEAQTNAMRGIRMLTSIETDILGSTMYAALQARHRRAVAAQAAAFEERVLSTVGHIATMSEGLQHMAGEAAGSSHQMRETSSAVAIPAGQSSQAMAGANVQIRHLDAMVASVDRNAKATVEATGLATERAAASAAAAMQLSQSSAEIGEILALIEQIVETTKILALNAQIEAAHAGAEGSGFSVVAQEVKQLAAQTSDATASISAKVREIIAATHEAAIASATISKTVEAIGQDAHRARAELRQQLDAISLITEAVGQTFDSAEQVSRGAIAIDQFSGHVDDQFRAVGEQLGALDALLGELSGEMRRYREGFGAMMHPG
ncbi:hypothetical protein J4558_03490 [Leptolyngbya sp. 15MV]|nr:hypothetical protein J4558_03490 [Leptolyngbya sp. 15MV]